MLIDEATELTYDQLVERLRQRYGSRDQHQMFKSQLEDRERGPNEGLQELAQHIAQLTKKAYPGLDSCTVVLLARDFFIKSLKSPGFQMKLKEHEPQSLSQAVAKAMKLETLYKSFERQKDAARLRLARSTQPDERQNRNGNKRPGGSKQYEARPTNNYNEDNNVSDEPRQNSTWKSRDIGLQSKENDELRDQVRQLSTKLSELTTKVNQTSNQVTMENPYSQQCVQLSPSSTGSYFNPLVQQAFQQPTFNEFQGQQYLQPPSYVSQEPPRHPPTLGQTSTAYNQQRSSTNQTCFHVTSTDTTNAHVRYYNSVQLSGKR